jgi:hypothetical protein
MKVMLVALGGVFRIDAGQSARPALTNTSLVTPASGKSKMVRLAYG